MAGRLPPAAGKGEGRSLRVVREEERLSASLQLRVQEDGDPRVKIAQENGAARLKLGYK